MSIRSKWLYNIIMSSRKYNEYELNTILDEYADAKPVRLHMPGHKGRFHRKNRKDITELSFSDNLMNPDGVLKRLSDYAAELYGAKKSFLIVNGSSSGMTASLLACLKPGQKVLVPRNSHVSVYNGLLLSDARPVWIYPKDSLRGPSQTELVDSAKNNPDASCIVITYPSYYGHAIDLEDTVEKIRKVSGDMTVIVDEAHGAHLRFSDSYPKCACECGADIVVMSAHKTLSAMNQTALLHVMTERADEAKIAAALRIMTTSSPSYVLLASLEESLVRMDEMGRQRLEGLKWMYSSFSKKCRTSTAFGIEEFEDGAHDWLKLAIDCSKSGFTGYETEEILRKDFNIYSEAASDRYVLCYLGVGTEQEDLDRLYEALRVISSRSSRREIVPPAADTAFCRKCEMSMKKAAQAESEWVRLDDSEGRTAADFIIAYPPGYPVAAPGEIIDEEVIEFLKGTDRRHEIVGIRQGLVRVVKE